MTESDLDGERLGGWLGAGTLPAIDRLGGKREMRRGFWDSIP
jgi:hypothetical protein